MKNKLKAVDLFAGAGGLSLGLEQSGFKVIFAIEKNKNFCETYKKNRLKEGGLLINDSIENIDFNKLLNKAKLKVGDIDLVAGGPPCQGFSTSNTKTRFKNNKQNKLFYEFLRAVKEIQPKWVLFENVSGIVNFRNNKFPKLLVEQFKILGYKDYDYKIINAAKYGVPQFRNRFILIANKINKKFSINDGKFGPEKKEYVTVKDAIFDLPILENGNNADVVSYRIYGRQMSNFQKKMRCYSKKTNCSNNLVTKNGELVLKRYKHIKQGQNWEVIPKNLMQNYKNRQNCHSGIYKRLKWNSPSVVISNYRKNMLIHPSQNRGLSVREAARIQSFNDQYVFYGTLGEQQQQVANAVPPIMIIEIIKSIIK